MLKKNFSWLYFLPLLLMLSCSSSDKYAVNSQTPRLVGNTPIITGSRYTVQRGDNLYRIAKAARVSIAELSAWNNLYDNDVINVGQVLWVKNPANSPKTYAQVQKTNYSPEISRAKSPSYSISSAGKSGWIWPAKGKLTQSFSENSPGKQGIRLSASRGTPVYAASSGTVRYVGDDVAGFGRMVLIEHSNKVLSAYSFLDNDIKVKEGQKVKMRQRIASVGVAHQNQALLHFEVRQNGSPVNPLAYIGSKPHY